MTQTLPIPLPCLGTKRVAVDTYVFCHIARCVLTFTKHAHCALRPYLDTEDRAAVCGAVITQAER